MNTWFTLLFKDFRLMRTPWVVMLGVLTAVGLGLADYAAHAVHGAEVGLAVMALILAGQLFYLPASILMALNHEWRHSAALWLQIPVSGWTLLGSKLTVSALFTVLAYAWSAVFAYWLLTMGLSRSFIPSSSLQFSVPPERLFFEFALYGLAGVVLLGLYLAVWVMMISVARHAVKNRLGILRSTVGVVIILIPLWGVPRLMGARWARALFRGWTVRLPLHMDLAGGHVPAFVHVFLGPVVMGAVIAGAVFLVAGWVMERKVEV